MARATLSTTTATEQPLISKANFLRGSQCRLLWHAMMRRCAFVATILGMAFLLALDGRTSPSPSDAIQKGESFLVNLFDPDLGLLPEYRGANVYWLFHDNYLAAKVLAHSHAQTAQRILAAMHREGIYKSGKIELIFGEAERPLPFRQYQLKDVRRTPSKVIRTEAVTDRILDGWEDYADLPLLACIAERNEPAGYQHWEAAVRLWDGQGFLDAAARHDHRYATYKLGLAVLAASRLSPPAKPPRGLVERLLAMQDDSGGWITDYDAAGRRIGVANVETTCLAIVGLEALIGRRESPAR